MMHLQKDQLLTLLRTAKEHSERDWLLFTVAYLHGLRISEVLSLTPSNVRDGFLAVQRLKGSLKTVQPLVTHVEPLLNERPALEQIVQGLAPDQRIFRNLDRVQSWRLMQKYGQKAGLPEHLLHPHTLKHTAGMATISKGIEFTRQYLGHKSISSTGSYLRVSDLAASQAVQGCL